jgi:FAD/FMN-containing dehydrogenase
VSWDDARAAWNLTADQHPAAVAFPESPADVQAVVRFAHGRGMRVDAQGTGHNATAIASLENTVLLRIARMRAVTIDADARRARVEAGAWWGDLLPPASDHEDAAAVASGRRAFQASKRYTIPGGAGLACASRRSAAASTVAKTSVLRPIRRRSSSTGVASSVTPFA